MGKLTGFKEYKRKNFKKRDIKARVEDYKEIYIPSSDEELQIQAARCMECGVPFCNWGCPLGNIIPDWNDMIYKDNWEKAFKRLTLTNNFPEFTGKICPAPCESSCTLGVNKQPVSIREIEVSIIEKAFAEGWIKPNPPKIRTGKKVAVVGSGPAGLAVAAELNSVGHEVVVFERNNEIGGLLRYGIPDFKLDKAVVQRRVDLMKAEGIEFKAGVNVGIDVKAEELKENYDSVVLTGGSTIPRDLIIKGREFEGTYFAMDFLASQNRRVSGEKIDKFDITAEGKNVLVIGGGDTGSDCVGTSVRHKAKKVYQFEILPKPPEERDPSTPWPLYPKALKTTTSHEEGCERQWSVATKEIFGKDGKVTGVKAVKVEWSKDENGRFTMSEVKDSEFEFEVDLVLIAMGFVHPQQEGLLNDLGLKYDGRGNVFSDENHMTSEKGIFTAGDMKNGQSLVVRAISDGRKTAKFVDEYLMGESYLNG
ncbi:glutamate synthase subunit beta [Clostridium grantii]|uniref:Glutamate synthase (NADH) small subunit n=1 Tax=Clostridium grantii DSM 8605 TaxID=1121316 RepID=A0A1M5WU37_9CLOT|nr:glutamate synthase subunit beta [Clostridium grantii]SHH90922.1 glutamate synthase (NADH) small subunit [Clostridium grantii DSM 8605]